MSGPSAVRRLIGRDRAAARLLATALAAGLLVLAGCERALLTPERARQLFVERSLVVDGMPYRYRVYLPLRYSHEQKWPVVLFLHGSTECGVDNLVQTESGLGAIIAADREKFPALAVFPQARGGQEWVGRMEDMAEAELDATVAEFNGDPNQLVVTGLSLGGTGAWYFARHPRRFAATVPMAGEIIPAPVPFPEPLQADVERLVHAPDRFAALAQLIGSTPVWAFHGARDDVVPVAQSRQMVAALRAAGGNVRYTEYPFLEHDVWDTAYRDTDVLAWMLRQRLTAPGNSRSRAGVVR
jgi:predicted peptidase